MVPCFKNFKNLYIIHMRSSGFDYICANPNFFKTSGSSSSTLRAEFVPLPSTLIFLTEKVDLVRFCFIAGIVLVE